MTHIFCKDLQLSLKNPWRRLHFGASFNTRIVASKRTRWRAQRAHSRHPSAVAALLGGVLEKVALSVKQTNTNKKGGSGKGQSPDARSVEENENSEREIYGSTQYIVKSTQRNRFKGLISTAAMPSRQGANVALRKLGVRLSARNPVAFIASAPEESCRI